MRHRPPSSAGGCRDRHSASHSPGPAHSGCRPSGARRAWQDNGLIFTTKTGRPIEPRNLVRSFHRICDANKLRSIKVHHLRHTTATLLKNLGVPARDAQIILGHSRLAVTLEIYTHEDRQAQRQALGRISEALGHRSESPTGDTADRE